MRASGPGFANTSGMLDFEDFVSAGSSRQHESGHPAPISTTGFYILHAGKWQVRGNDEGIGLAEQAYGTSTGGKKNVFAYRVIRDGMDQTVPRIPGFVLAESGGCIFCVVPPGTFGW